MHIYASMMERCLCLACDGTPECSDLSVLCAGQVMCRSSHFAAHIHSVPDEETATSREEAREGGGVGEGDIWRTLSDAMEQL